MAEGDKEERPLTLKERMKLLEQSASGSSSTSQQAGRKAAPSVAANSASLVSSASGVTSLPALTDRPRLHSNDTRPPQLPINATRFSRASSTASSRVSAASPPPPSSPRMPVKDIISLYGRTSSNSSSPARSSDALSTNYPPLSPTLSVSGSSPGSPAKSRPTTPLGGPCEPITLESFSNQMRSRAGSSASPTSASAILESRGRSTSGASLTPRPAHSGLRTSSPTSLRSSNSYRDLAKLDTTTVPADTHFDPLASNSSPTTTSVNWTVHPPTPSSSTNNSFMRHHSVPPVSSPPPLPSRSTTLPPSSRSSSTATVSPPALPPRPTIKSSSTLSATSSKAPPIPVRPSSISVTQSSTSTHLPSQSRSSSQTSQPPSLPSSSRSNPQNPALTPSVPARSAPNGSIKPNPSSSSPSNVPARKERPIDPRSRLRYERLFNTLLRACSDRVDGSREERVEGKVVSKVWEKSRLERSFLRQVWQACDRDRKGTLNKEEFVKGIWMIDEELRSRAKS